MLDLHGRDTVSGQLRNAPGEHLGRIVGPSMLYEHHLYLGPGGLRREELPERDTGGPGGEVPEADFDERSGGTDDIGEGRAGSPGTPLGDRTQVGRVEADERRRDQLE